MKSKRNYKKTYIKKDKAKMLVEQLISYMEKGDLPWHKPWTPLPPPQNGLTHYVYDPFNQFVLSLKMMEQNSPDPRFYTFTNINSQKYWRLRKGAEATWIRGVFKKELNEEKEDLLEEELENELTSLKDLKSEKAYYRTTWTPMYHASDVRIYPALLDEKGEEITELREIINPFTGKKTMEKMPVLDLSQEPQLLPEPEIPTYNHEEIYDKAEQIIAASGANVFTEKIDKAFFSPMRDEIHVPVKEHFERLEDYYGTLMHELTHWTGHHSRLNRDLSGIFGSTSYAREELVAELSSVFLSQSANVPVNFEKNAAYLQSWIKSMREDPKFLFSVVADAEKAHDYLQGKIYEMEYIPITSRLEEACQLARDFSVYNNHEKPRGVDNLPDIIINNFKKTVKELELDDQEVARIFDNLNSIKTSILEQKPAELNYEKLAGMRDQFVLAKCRQKFSKINPEFLEKDKNHILSVNKKSRVIGKGR